MASKSVVRRWPTSVASLAPTGSSTLLFRRGRALPASQRGAEQASRWLHGYAERLPAGRSLSQEDHFQVTLCAQQTARSFSTTCKRWSETYPSLSRKSSSNKGEDGEAQESASKEKGNESNLYNHSARFVQTPEFPPPSFPKSFGANQVVPLEAEMQKRLDAVLATFPQPIRFAFAYGSGVFKQSEAGPEHSKRPETADGKKMVDIVMAVTHPEHWHAINMQQNKSHYSAFTRLMGGFLLGRMQRAGAGLWYHPYIKIGDELVKYGVMDINTLCADLLDWDTLYISGRMHKPVALGLTDARVRLAQQVNLTSALRTSLLLLPEQFTEVELYTRIASLSYTGDFRMTVPGGENSNKVRNIVLAQRDIFRRLYGGLLRSLATVQVQEARQNRFRMTQDCSNETRAEYASKLPLRLREKLQDHYTSSPDRDPAFLKLSISSKSDNVARKPGARAASLDPDIMKAFWLAVVRQPDFETVLLSKIADIVRGPARLQSLKGIYTAGVRRTLRYVLAKVGKYFEGRK